MKLKELAALLPTAILVGDGETEFTNIELNSHKSTPGTLYCCVPATPNLAFKDRHMFAADAVERGATALVLERDVEADVPKLFVKDVRYAMAVAANELYGHPSHALQVIAVTGTNGKTTTAHMIEHILRQCGQVTGLMGSLGMRIAGEPHAYEGNTMDSPDLQRSFLRMKEAGVRYCMMEASSHGLELGRVLGTRFRTGVFTNLTQDHLDFHLTMENYRDAKGLLFSRLGNTFAVSPEDRRFAVLNADDEASAYYRKITAAQVLTYGIENEADVRASALRFAPFGTAFTVRSFAGEADFTIKAVGRFNVYNALAAITAALAEGIALTDVRDAIATLDPVEGRMESVDEGQKFSVVVDYAHTPDGLDKALSTMREVTGRKLITVFGCGGDRDRGKRPIMGGLAAKYSDYVFVTSDNPRTEEPRGILLEIEPGLTQAGWDRSRYELEVDRREAIRRAIAMAGPGDAVLIAGKGHETYQLINGETHHFDDREEARAAIRGRG